MSIRSLLKPRETRGYVRRFEHRPELLFGSVVKKVIDAEVEERPLKEYTVARVEDVFYDYNVTFLVFGKPNTALVVPLANHSGYQKFAAFSVWRQAAHVQNITRDSGSLVQSGIWLRLVNLPREAAADLRVAMDTLEGKRFRTCVNGTMRVMDAAGFTSGKRSLSSITWPYQLMRTLLIDGLAYKGTPVRVEVVRTTRRSMEDYTRSIIVSEFTAPWRHFKKLPLVSRLVGASTTVKPVSAEFRPSEIAPALSSDRPYRHDINIRVTAAPASGRALRQIWGPHALFEASTDRINVDRYLSRALRPFPQKDPTLATRIKKNVLFSRPVIWMIRKIMGADRFHEIGAVSERDVYDMLRTHSDARPNKYNLVVVRMPPSQPGAHPKARFIVSRITVWSSMVDWVLSKHVLMSGYLWAPKSDEDAADTTKPYVVWAGECWKDPGGTISLSGNSGTYQPKKEADAQMLALTSTVFPNLVIRSVDHP